MRGRLRDWLGRLRDSTRRLLARGGAGSAGDDEVGDAGTGADGAATGYECAVCGTAVDGPGVSCPLCGADDVVPGDEARGDDGDDATGGAGPGEVREADATDDAAAQLRELRDGRDGGE